jgi:hypothetical protein
MADQQTIRKSDPFLRFGFFDSGGRTISGLDARLRLWLRYRPVYDSLIL